MHYITSVEYDTEYRLNLRFEDDSWRLVDLKEHLDGEVFEPLQDVVEFRTAMLNSDIDTVVWKNGADMSPDFLYDISIPVESHEVLKVAEEQEGYGTG